MGIWKAVGFRNKSSLGNIENVLHNHFPSNGFDRNGCRRIDIHSISRITHNGNHNVDQSESIIIEGELIAGNLSNLFFFSIGQVKNICAGYYCFNYFGLKPDFIWAPE